MYYNTGLSKHQQLAACKELTEYGIIKMKYHGMPKKRYFKFEPSAFNKLFALSEAYPDLKANTNFMSLQNDLKDTEDKITYARQFYNDTAMSFNDLVEMFPSNIVAKMFGFKKYDFFQAAEKDKEVVKVKF
jgi:hypothetical protein